MAKTIKPEMLGNAIENQLTLYHENVIERITAVFEKAVKSLVQKTKASAPVSSGDFRKHIAWKKLDAKYGEVAFVWYVKAPFHRLTHLLVHGHATVNGGRVKGSSFLADALEAILPECESEIQEAVKDG